MISEFKNALGLATQSVTGLMAAEDKAHLDTLVALLAADDADNIVNTISEILAIFENYPEGADLLDALNGKVDKIAGKGLSENDLTSARVTQYGQGYSHSQVTGTNPHATKIQSIN